MTDALLLGTAWTFIGFCVGFLAGRATTGRL